MSARWYTPLTFTVAGVVSLLLYLLTKPPTVTWWFGGSDSGDLASAADVLGIPHPTGYPLFMLLGHTATRLPFAGSDPAGRINTLNTVLAAAGVGLVALTVLALGRRLGGPPWAWCGGAAVAALAVGTSSLYWSQAIIGEVYALHAALTALVLWVWARRHTPSFARGAAHGLALTNHLTSLVLLGAAIVAFVPRWRPRTSDGAARPITVFLFGLALPLLLYALLPLRAAQQPAANWGDPSTPGRFLAHVTGRQYGSLIGWRQPLTAPRDVASLLRLAAGDLPLWVLPVAAVGAVRLWRVERPYAVFTVLIAGGTLAGTALYRTSDRAPYLLPAYLTLGVWSGIGLATLAVAARGLATERAGVWYRSVLPAGAAVIVLLTLVWTVRAGRRVNLHGDDSAVVFARAVLEALPPNATYYTARDDVTFALWYAQRSLGLRPDVTVVDLRNPALTARP